MEGVSSKKHIDASKINCTVLSELQYAIQDNINKEEKVRKSMKKHYEYYFAKCEDILCYIKIRERENHLLKIINVIIFLNKPCHNQEVNFKSYKEQYKILV